MLWPNELQNTPRTVPCQINCVKILKIIFLTHHFQAGRHFGSPKTNRWAGMPKGGGERLRKGSSIAARTSVIASPSRSPRRQSGRFHFGAGGKKRLTLRKKSPVAGRGFTFHLFIYAADRDCNPQALRRLRLNMPNPPRANRPTVAGSGTAAAVAICSTFRSTSPPLALLPYG